jgi:alpha-glucosidase
MRTILKSRFRPNFTEKIYSKAIANESPFLKFPLEGLEISAPSLSPVFSQGVDGEFIAEIEVHGGGSHFYGGGETSLGLCLNNKTFHTWCTDAYAYDSKSSNLYQAHPYVMGVNKDGSSFGVIADTHYPLEFQMSDSKITIRNVGQFATTSDGLEDTTPPVKEPFSVVIFEEKTPQELIKKLAFLTGKIAMPPKWSLGYHQCRWSYYPDVQALEIAD